MPGGYLVQTGTLIVCPHGGMVQLMTSNTRAVAMATLVTAPLPVQVIQPCSLAASGAQCTALNVLVPTTRVMANGSPLFAFTPEPTTISAGPSPGPGQAAGVQTRVWGM
jgi:hypothetical protein